ncbi:MAG: acyl-CoA synthetase FdrA [Chloroflexi bacterium]|nr:acyl-CoA synthetase FdrA [Chloroflexota bacterium]
MPIIGLLKAKTYRDSVALMVLSSALSETAGVVQASAMMGTPANLEIMHATGLLTPDCARAGPNDLCIGLEVSDAAFAASVLAEAERLLAAAGGSAGGAGVGGSTARQPRTLRSAARARADANLALISVPGEYAALEARAALAAGLHVFLFSDNVSLADEVALKQEAAELGLLVMGPDCGTAIVGEAPLGFANAVRRGPIGVVGSSGTGLQEITSQIHRLGGGVSHAIGTGGRDLYGAVGGRTFLAAIDALAVDPATQVLVGIAKPGDAAVERAVLDRLAATGKPSVVYFLGGADAAAATSRSVTLAVDLEHAARCAVALANGEPPPPPPDPDEAEGVARQIVMGLLPKQRAVRGLFAGGTLAQEAASAVSRALGVASLADGASRAGEVLKIGPHGILDLGDDAYTRGRPHPLIDPRLRNAELTAEAARDEVGLILLDVILGTGSHADPAGALTPAVLDARAMAQARGASLEILASLCGTEDDAQGYGRQRALLEDAGVRVVRSSSLAAAVAGRVAALLAEVEG